MKQFVPEIRRVAEMYDYTSSPAGPLPDHIDVTFVYGRKSAHLVDAVAEAAARSEYLVGSGGRGKDSGDLPAQDVNEMDYLFSGVFSGDNRPNIGTGNIRTDYKAWTGLEGAQNGVKMIGDLAVPINSIVTVQHPAQTMRLGGTFRQQAKQAGLAFGTLSHYASSYPFNARNILDQYEVANELTTINTFSKGKYPMLERPADFPDELAEYAAVLKKHLQEEFKRRGIRNPSTADDTNQAESVVRMLLLAPRSTLERQSKAVRRQAIASRGLGLAVAFARQQRTRLPV